MKPVLARVARQVVERRAPTGNERCDDEAILLQFERVNSRVADSIAYCANRNDVVHFMHTMHITETPEFRKVDRMAVVAWKLKMEQDGAKPRRSERLCRVFATLRHQPNLDPAVEGGGNALEHAKGVAFVVSILKASDDGLLGPNKVRQLLLCEPGFGPGLVNHPRHLCVERLFRNELLQRGIVAGEVVKDFERISPTPVHYRLHPDRR